MKYKFDAALPENCSLDRVKQVMEAWGSTWAHRFPAAELQLAEEIWLLPNDRGAIRYVYDHFVEVSSVRAESDIHSEPAKILIDLERDLPLLHIEDLSKQVDPTSPGRRFALRALAAITTSYHGDVISAFKAAIRDPDLSFRKLATLCVARYPAFIFAKELDQQAAVESDSELKEEQLRLADELRAHGKRGSLW